MTKQAKSHFKRPIRSFSRQLPLSTMAALVFCLGVLWGYQILRARQEERLGKIYSQLATLENRKSLLESEEARMHEEIYSQSDPAWVEMVLIKKLGFVPKGSDKVLFVGSSPSS